MEDENPRVSERPSLRARLIAPTMRAAGVLISLIATTFVFLPSFSRWQPHNLPYEQMFAAMFFAWGFALYRAAEDPMHAISVIDFTWLEGVLHGSVMLYHALSMPTERQHLLSDVPFHLLLGAVFLWLRPRASEAPPVSPRSPEERRAILNRDLVLFTAIFATDFVLVFVARR